MQSDSLSEILELLSNHLFCDSSELTKCNLAQVHTIMNILISANISFTVNYNERTKSTAANIAIVVEVSPTLRINKLFQLEEGRLTP